MSAFIKWFVFHCNKLILVNCFNLKKIYFMLNGNNKNSEKDIYFTRY